MKWKSFNFVLVSNMVVIWVKVMIIEGIRLIKCNYVKWMMLDKFWGIFDFKKVEK